LRDGRFRRGQRSVLRDAPSEHDRWPGRGARSRIRAAKDRCEIVAAVTHEFPERRFEARVDRAFAQAVIEPRGERVAHDALRAARITRPADDIAPDHLQRAREIRQ
jgi:hypothetical protein